MVVAGFGRAGFAAADNLLHLGADVLAVDGHPALDDEQEEKAELLRVLGADIRLAASATQVLPSGTDLLIASPEYADDAPLLVQAADRGVPVWGEVELAWRLRDPETAAPWLVVAGSEDAAALAEVTALAERMLLAAGKRPVVTGAVGLPIVEAVMDPEPYDALVVALTDDQLRHLTSMGALAAAVTDGAAAARGVVYENVAQACIYLSADEATVELVREADVQEGARAIGVTLGTPGVGMLGVVEDLLVERAYLPERATSAAELGALADLRSDEPGHVTRVLVAAALALALGVPPVAVRDGLRSA